ncbi:RNA polymerase sigma factor [Microbacterium sp. BWT-B31]|uniref:RNA polymerase sigma factor n=1 Tax=Microbacterium sp. BWT-B31 TaxID=3232072 RepID=UPI00352830E1
MTAKQQAFESLFAAHFIEIVRFAERRVGDTQTAEDIAQATFELAWSRLDRQPITAPWLIKTAGNKVKEHLRRSRRKVSADAALQRREEERPVGLDALESLALRSALHLLTDRERTVVELTYWEGLSAQQIGEVLGASDKTVWVTLSRARAKMRPALERTTEGVQR